MAIAEAGEADIVYCTKCDYAANIEIGKPGIMETGRRSTARVIHCRYSKMLVLLKLWQKC